MQAFFDIASVILPRLSRQHREMLIADFRRQLQEEFGFDEDTVAGPVAILQRMHELLCLAEDLREQVTQEGREAKHTGSSWNWKDAEGGG